MKLELFAIGEVMAEIRREPELGFRVGFAGDTFNTAVYCARQLGASGRVGYCTRVGLDPLSEAFLAMAAEEDLDVSHVARDQEHFIGIYTVSTGCCWRAQLPLLAQQLGGSPAFFFRRPDECPSGGADCLCIGYYACDPASPGPPAPHRPFAHLA